MHDELFEPIPTRLLPYGAYLAREGMVLFDRRYRPIALIPFSGGAITPVDPRARIAHLRRAYFYDDKTNPARNRNVRTELEEIVALMPVVAAEIERRKKLKTVRL